ncbi:uncharacterized protein LOC129754609 [Uranotaenia lowii]|uniref:uncharacterized protein LOC129754609 n=1 Tax=Uranotaenia lowii TaxID=190385 RepID=UPI002479C512|nr:uncharacterized protein LOC129754609 [Uranotaenia lowii]
MAKLLAYYSLCPINDVQDFLGMSRDVDSGCVINTLGRNIIQVVKLSNQKLQRSWTALDRLTSKVVYDFRSERYVGVFGGRHIRCWPADQNDINKVKKVKFFRTIRELFTLANGQVLVLYEDGSCESLESAVETRNEDRKDPDNVRGKANIDMAGETILEVITVPSGEEEFMLAYFVREQASGTVVLNYALLTKDSLKPDGGFRKIRLERGEQKVQLMGQTIVDGSVHPMLISIWSDKRIFSQTLALEKGQSPEVQPKSIGNFISILNMINTAQPLSMVGISKDYIAIYANNMNQEGATLLLYNVQFKVVQAKQFFKVYFNNSKFWLCEQHILLAFGQTLSVVPYKISKEQLSDMVGTQRSFELGNYVDNESINEDCEFNENFVFQGASGKTEESGVTDDEEELDESDEELDTNKNPFKLFESVEKFEELLEASYKSGLKVDVLRDATLPHGLLQMRLMSNVDNSLGPLIFSEKFEILVGELERHGFSEMDITDKVLPLMIQANASLDIGKCLKRYSTVSERALVSALKYSLSCEDNQTNEIGSSKKSSKGKTTSDDIPLSDPPSFDVIESNDIQDNSAKDLLNIVLSCSFNRSSILPLLRNEIGFNTLKQLLDHLQYLLTDPVARLVENPAAVPDEFDSDEKVIEWVALLIDSHFQQIILSRDAALKQKLLDWIEVVKRHTAGLNELKALASEIRRLAEGKFREGEKGFNRWYNVEIVQLY